MVSKHIEHRTKLEIVKELNDLFDRYIKDGLSLKQMKNYFKGGSAIKILIKDINEKGRRFFDTYDEYHSFITKIVKDVLHDRIAETETKKLQENMNIKKYSEFEYQKESIDYTELTPEYLFDDITCADDDFDIIANHFKTNKEYIEVLDKEYCVYSITDFKTDILSNNRTRLNVLLLSTTQLEKMKDNVTEKIVSGLYNLIPMEVQYMGIQVSVHTVLDKQRIKDAVKVIVDKNIIDIITNVTKYKFDEKYGEEYYIWKQIK